MSIASDARFWDRTSRRYAKSAVADPDGYARTLQRTRAYLKSGASVLELGCGTGTTARQLADGVRNYLATDLSSAMIAIAEEQLMDCPPMPSLSFRIATAEELTREDDRFDVVLGFNYLHLVRDVPGTLHDIHDLLEPGGVFISKTPCLGDMNPLIRLALLPAMKAIGIAPHANSFGASALQQRIIDSGFEILLIESHASKGEDRRPFIVARKRRLGATSIPLRQDSRADQSRSPRRQTRMCSIDGGELTRRHAGRQGQNDRNLVALRRQRSKWTGAKISAEGR